MIQRLLGKLYVQVLIDVGAGVALAVVTGPTLTNVNDFRALLLTRASGANV